MTESLLRTLSVSRHELRLLRRNANALFLMLIVPLVLLLLMQDTYRELLQLQGVTEATGAEQGIPGVAVMFVFFVVGFVALSVQLETLWLTWNRLQVTPLHAAEMVLGKLLPYVALAILQQVLFFGIGVAAFDLRFQRSALLVVPIATLFSASLVALGMIVANIAKSPQQANAITNVSFITFGLMGGALVPRQLLPTWAERLSAFTPTQWAMDGYQGLLLARGQSLFMPLLVLLMFCAGFGVLAVASLRPRLVH